MHKLCTDMQELNPQLDDGAIEDYDFATVAILGSQGSGKSTLINLLLQTNLLVARDGFFGRQTEGQSRMGQHVSLRLTLFVVA